MAAILIVEDDPDNCELLSRFLARAKHTTLCARNGREAIVALTQSPIDLLLLDMGMPEMDGITFLQVLRSYLRWTVMPVILITGMDDPDLMARAAELGVKRVFRKANFKLEDLLPAINELLPPPRPPDSWPMAML
jgi:CheY-like chemotaxis protein